MPRRLMPSCTHLLGFSSSAPVLLLSSTPDGMDVDLRLAVAFPLASSSGSTPMEDYTINDDFRAQGLQGDDDDDITGGGGAEVLGASASTPVDVDDGSPTASTAKKARHARATTSDVWNDMEEVKELQDGKLVRVGAICNFCKTRLSASSNGGTGHLHRHILSCKKKAVAGSSSSQSHLHFDSAGNVQRFVYKPMVARTELVRLIARLDLPLNIGEQPAWGDYIRTAFCPDYI
ncbi:hypothetical protein QOZ80_3BG0277790 [Eleusine coracana subsp. coracana]|nr:hypothetical protein QOZ80_3BG0277790 [Eleusine coracana subsp. coracana]